MTRILWLLVGVTTLFWWQAGPATGESYDAWRTPFGRAWSVSVDAHDGSVWAATGMSVMHVAHDGTILSQTNNPWRLQSLSANSSDGSCWMVEDVTGKIVHLSAEGAELWRSADSILGPVGYSLSGQEGLSVDPRDGSVWVASHYTSVGSNSALGVVVHLSAAGAELWRSGPIGGWISCAAVNTSDGSCWVAGEDSTGGDEALVHLSADGRKLWNGGGFSTPSPLSVNASDGSVWVGESKSVAHVSQDGTLLSRTPGFNGAFSVSVNPADGSCWVVDADNAQVVHLSKAGGELWRGSDFSSPISASADPTDGSCWVADMEAASVVHLLASGQEQWRGYYLQNPGAVSVNTADGSCWTSDMNAYGLHYYLLHLSADGEEVGRSNGVRRLSLPSVNSSDGSVWAIDAPPDGNTSGGVVHLSASGEELSREAFFAPYSISANPADGSCWVAGAAASPTYPNGAVAHLSADGQVLWQGSFPGFPGAGSVAASVVDNGCWVGIWDASNLWSGTGQVLHLAENGQLLSQSGGFAAPTGLSVDPTDGSCWVADPYDLRATHLSPTGSVLSASGPGGRGIAVNPKDGSYWAAGPAGVIHVTASGELSWVWQGNSYYNVWSVSVDPADGSCWVADSDNGQVAHVVKALFADVLASQWARAQIAACVRAGIVSGYPDGTYGPSNPVTRDQMAVYISRALAGGDANVPTGPATAIFSDVPIDYWAFKYVEYAVDQGVVKGYSDGTYKPTDQVDRGQMAVFIARSIATPTAGADLVNYTPPATATFPDVPTSFWAYKYVEYIAQSGIGVTKGYPDGDYHPEYICTRDQMAVYVARAFKLPV